MGQGLKGADRLVELFPLFGILHGDVERLLRRTHRIRAQQRQAFQQRLAPDLPAGVLPPNAVVGGNDHVGKRDFVLGVRCHGLLLLELHARCISVHQEKVQGLRVVAGPYQDQELVGRLPVEHVPLDTIQAVPVGGDLRPHLHPLRAEPVARLEPGRSDDRLPRTKALEQRLLRIGAGVADGRHRHDGALEDRPRCEAAPELFEDDDAIEQGQPHAAVLLGQTHGEKARFLHLLPELPGKSEGVVFQFPDIVGGAGISTQGLDHVPEGLLLFCKLQIHGGRLSSNSMIS